MASGKEKGADSMTEEHAIQNAIRSAISKYCIIFRINVGKGYTKDGRYFQTGVPPGFLICLESESLTAGLFLLR